MMQAGELSMNVGWSPAYGSWYYDCIYGCHETDFEGQWEAEQAFLSHVCRSAGEVPC